MNKLVARATLWLDCGSKDRKQWSRLDNGCAGVFKGQKQTRSAIARRNKWRLSDGRHIKIDYLDGRVVWV